MIHKVTLRRTIGWSVAIAIAFVLAAHAAATRAASTAYYVSLTGNDKNAGTAAAPFRTFAKAASVLLPGDTLNILGRVYNEPLLISHSGTDGAFITVQPAAGQKVVIDLLGQTEPVLQVTGSYVIVQGLELRNSAGYCADLQGTHNTLRDSQVHECATMGIHTNGQDESILHNTVYHASLANISMSATGGWSSGIKVRVGGQRILIEGNTVYNNYGEGIAVTRGVDVTVRGNTVHDNYSNNIYIDNSHDVLVEGNFTFNHPNNGFSPSGTPCENITLGEEIYPDWGAQLFNVTVRNNIAYNGRHGVAFFQNQSGLSDAGLKDSTIAYNTLWGSTYSEIYMGYAPGQSGNLIIGNVVQQPHGKLVFAEDPAGQTFSENFWVGTLPPTYARSPGDRSGNVQLAGVPGYSPGRFALAGTSPAIDGGGALSEVTADFANAPRPVGEANDMGAFEYQTARPTAPTLSVSSLDFGDQLAGTTSAFQIITLTNVAPVGLSIASIKTAAPFSLVGTSTCPIAGGQVSAGSSCQIRVRFSPIAPGSVSGSLVISSNAISSPQTVALAGTGVAGTQLLMNPDFENDADLNNRPDDWQWATLAARDGRDCNVAASGSCSLRIKGNGRAKTVRQVVMQSGVAGDDFAFRLASRAYNVPVGAVYRLQVQFFNGTTLLKTKTMSFKPGNHGFSVVHGSFTATEPYTMIVFKITFKSLAGKAWFDAAQLNWAS